jgi:AcrR family transcriptional regulator
LTNLLLKKDIKEISVKELTAEADINRSTFYLHYNDIYHLYNQIQDDLYHEIRVIFERHLNHNRRAGLLLVVTEAFEFLSKNKDLCLVILNSDHSELLGGIIELGKPKTKEEWLSLLGNVEPELYEYYYSFITSGCLGLLRFWLSEGMNEPPEKMAKVAGKLIEKAYIP